MIVKVVFYDPRCLSETHNTDLKRIFSLNPTNQRDYNKEMYLKKQNFWFDRNEFKKDLTCKTWDFNLKRELVENCYSDWNESTDYVSQIVRYSHLQIHGPIW